MNKSMTIVAMAALMLTASCTQKETNEKVNIQKQTVKLQSDQMTPEALWAMSRLGAYQASPDGLHIVFQTGYYSVEENASHQVLWMMKSDGSEQRQLTTEADNETDAQWLDNETIAFLKGGEVWSMDLEGNARKQLSHSEGAIEGFMFSPDRSKVILLKSIDFNDIIKAKPADLPKTIGRVVTDLMYRHWDHYVETIQHPFVAVVDVEGICDDAVDILQDEPFECPMEPFGGMEQLAWSTDSKQIAYTCRKKTGLAYSISTDSDIFLYDVEKKETKNLCKPADYVEPTIEPSKTMLHQAVNAPENLKNLPGYDQNPKFSPDGRYITWLSMARNGYEADRMRLCCCDLQTGEKTFLTESFDSNVDDYCWAPDSKTIYFIGVWHATENLYSTNLQGEVKQITGLQADFGSLQMLGDKKRLLMERTKESLYRGIAAAVKGNTTGDIGHAVQTYCESFGYGVVRELCGHGIGRNMHEKPDVCNYGKPGKGDTLREGMVICIEPMITMGSRKIYCERDEWTIRTMDHKPAAHYEHQIAITKNGTRVLSTYKFIGEVLGTEEKI